MMNTTSLQRPQVVSQSRQSSGEKVKEQNGKLASSGSRRPSFRKKRDVKQEKDCNSSSGTRTSCTSHDTDCGELLWDELSTGSSTEQESDGWSNRSHSPVGRRSTDTETPTPVELVSISQGVSSPMQSPTSWNKTRRQNGKVQESHESGQQCRGRMSPTAQIKRLAGQSQKEAAPIRRYTPDSAERGASGPLLTRVRQIVRPINIGPPTEYDFRNTNGLMKCLNAIAPLPNPEELSAKHLVINEVQRLVDDWLQIAFGPDKETTATLLLGGSWHLKVGLSESDLDIVTLLPNFVTSESFFGSLYEYLRATTCVTKIVAMNKAAVPVLAFQLNGVRIDLLFARYTQDVVPKNLPIHSDQVLVGMDATSIRSLSVPRVASLILELVPNGCAFRSCLRIVRLWAKHRGLYSNKAGFLGGISWTILVAFVCQMFPKATISSVIHRFFTILSTWSWPTPVLISKPYESSEITSCAQWNPQKHHHDRGHLMPIITPGFPAVNSSVNVNESTMRVLQEEFERGKRIMDEMQAKGLSSPAVWHKLFAPTEFLVRYDHYLVIELRAQDDDELSEWANFVASRTRKLVETLQLTSSIESVHPLPELVKPQHHQSRDESKSIGYYLLAYTISPSTKSEMAKTCALPDVRYFMGTELANCAEKKSTMHAEISYARWQDLPESMFPNGRAAAAGDRARFILSKAHSNNVSLGLGR